MALDFINKHELSNGLGYSSQASKCFIVQQERIATPGRVCQPQAGSVKFPLCGSEDCDIKMLNTPHRCSTYFPYNSGHLCCS